MSIDVTVSGLNTQVDVTLSEGSQTVTADVSEFIIIDPAPAYQGSYEVTPKTSEQTLPTTGKSLWQDVTVHKIPYYETSNVQGTTVYIANEV